jgi:hypothetical protein
MIYLGDGFVSDAYPIKVVDDIIFEVDCEVTKVFFSFIYIY